MIFVEDNKSYELRMVEEWRRQQDEDCRKCARQFPPLTQLILDIIKSNGDDPIKIVHVVNQFVREAGHDCKSRAERVELKLKAFRTISNLLHGFFIERYRRKWVLWMPPDNPKRKALELKVEEND